MILAWKPNTEDITFCKFLKPIICISSEFQISFKSIEQAMEEYLSKREEYRENKNFDQADLMRDQLKEIGILIKDGENGGWYWENR